MIASKAILTRIAEALGVPVQALQSGSGRRDLDQLDELLRLWLAIERPGDRMDLLLVARGIVDAQPSEHRRS